MEISNWFKGFEKGLARLSPEQRTAFFSECGKNCVNPYPAGFSIADI